MNCTLLSDRYYGCQEMLKAGIDDLITLSVNPLPAGIRFSDLIN